MCGRTTTHAHTRTCIWMIKTASCIYLYTFICDKSAFAGFALVEWATAMRDTSSVAAVILCRANFYLTLVLLLLNESLFDSVPVTAHTFLYHLCSLSFFIWFCYGEPIHQSVFRCYWNQIQFRFLTHIVIGMYIWTPAHRPPLAYWLYNEQQFVARQQQLCQQILWQWQCGLKHTHTHTHICSHIGSLHLRLLTLACVAQL